MAKNKNKTPASKKPARKKTAVKKATVKKGAVKKALKAAPKKTGAGNAAAKGKTKSNPKSSGARAAKTRPRPSAEVLQFKTPMKRISSAAFDKLFKPLQDGVLVEPAGQAERTPGGLYIPETVQQRPNQGRVVAIGQGKRQKKGHVRPLDVQLGDQVLFANFAGQKLVLEGRDVILLKEEEILGVLKD